MELQELEKHRAIPRGGLKLLAFILLYVAIFFGTAGLNGLAVFLITSKMPNLTATVILAAGLTLFLFCAPLLLSRYPIRWARDYWRRNVRGYEACFWIEKDEGVDPDVSVWVEELRRPPYWAPCELNGRGKIFLRVPLGGWFRKQGQLYGIRAAGESSERAPFRAWRVIVRKPITDPLIGSCIEVFDGKGYRVPLTVSETLRFTAWVLRGGGGGFQEWHHEVPCLLRAVREGRAERDEARRQLKGVIEQMVETVDRLDATRRFIKSKEAREIRLKLVRKLDQLLEPNDPRREKYCIVAILTASEAGKRLPPFREN